MNRPTYFDRYNLNNLFFKKNVFIYKSVNYYLPFIVKQRKVVYFGSSTKQPLLPSEFNPSN